MFMAGVLCTVCGAQVYLYYFMDIFYTRQPYMSSWKSSKEGDLLLSICQRGRFCSKPSHDIYFVQQRSKSS